MYVAVNFHDVTSVFLRARIQQLRGLSRTSSGNKRTYLGFGITFITTFYQNLYTLKINQVTFCNHVHNGGQKLVSVAHT